MLFGLVTLLYQLFLVVSSFTQSISTQCIPHESCSLIQYSHSECCPKLTRNAVIFPTTVVNVANNSQNITATSAPTIPKINFSFKVNTTIISCGRQMLDNNKIVGGSETRIAEFPWMAVIFYSKYNSNECAGSVIHKLFILTAAHCLVGRILHIIGKPFKVRLGEYDLTTDPDCLSNNYCAPNAVDIQILGSFPHPKYLSNSKSSYDIGIIKLIDEVVYTDYIQPICFDQDIGNDFFGQSFVVAGWGKTEKGDKSNRLLKASVPYANITKCQQVYNAINVRDDHICAGGNDGIDSCRGDSGGALIIFKNNVWSAVGLVSIGHSICGKPNHPALYTRINAHLKWLQRKMYSA